MWEGRRSPAERAEDGLNKLLVITVMSDAVVESKSLGLHTSKNGSGGGGHRQHTLSVNRGDGKKADGMRGDKMKMW